MKVQEIGNEGEATHIFKHTFKKMQSDTGIENAAKSICGNNNWVFVGMKQYGNKRITVFFRKMTTVEIMKRSAR